MGRITWGAETLIDQVRALRKNVEVEYGDPDGLEVARSVRFDKDTSKWLEPLLSVQLDPRIESLDLTASGYLHVNFQPTPVADGREPFPLADVDRVLNEPVQAENLREDLTTAEHGSVYVPDPNAVDEAEAPRDLDVPPPKKAPAKKAAPKRA